MTNLDPTTATPPRPRRFRTVLLSLLMLSLIAGFGLGARKLYLMRADTEETVEQQEALLLRIERQLTLQQGQLDDLEGHVADLNQTTHDQTDQLGTAQSRLDGAEQSLARVQAAVQGGRTRMQLLTVEQLLLTANDRAQLTGDAHGAAGALALAQERLGALADPQLFAIRKSVAAELVALQAIGQADSSSAALTLGAMIDRVGQLPLRSAAPDRFQANVPVPAAAADASWRQHLWSSVRGALQALFTVRRTDQTITTLLPAEQQALIGEVLVLRLETARTALLAGDTAAFRDVLDAAAKWLNIYYRSDDPGVLSAQANIEKLQALDLRPPLPDLSGGLVQLRAYLDTAPK